jgi:ribosomal protein S18 acetylase RimI-like enzyme
MPDLIVPADVSDIPDILVLVNSAYRGEASKKGWTTEADLLDGIRIDDRSLREILIKQDATLLKYISQSDEIEGCVYLEKYDEDLYLGMLSVSPFKQSKGIGKQLLEASEEYARQEGLKAVVMTVISVRTELIAWYERMGYKQTGELKPFPNDTRFGIPKQPLQFIVMKKLLENKLT